VKGKKKQMPDGMTIGWVRDERKTNEICLLHLSYCLNHDDQDERMTMMKKDKPSRKMNAETQG